MPDYIVLGSNHKWFACYQWSEVQNLAKEMFKNGCDQSRVFSLIKYLTICPGALHHVKVVKSSFYSQTGFPLVYPACAQA